MCSLNALASRAVVDEQVRVLGQPRALEVLAVTPARLTALLAGRGRLGALQPNRIAALTRWTWPLWALDAAESHARTKRHREIIAANQIMRDHYERFAADEIAGAEVALGLRPAARAAKARPAAKRLASRRRTVPSPRRVTA